MTTKAIEHLVTILTEIGEIEHAERIESLCMKLDIATAALNKISGYGPMQVDLKWCQTIANTALFEIKDT